MKGSVVLSLRDEGPVPYQASRAQGEVLPCCLTENRDELFQLNTGLQLGVVREIAGDDLFLVEVAHLGGDVGEELSHAGPAI